MSKKKFFMIFLLCAFIILIGFFVVKVNDKSQEKIGNNSKTQEKVADSNSKKSENEIKIDTENMIEITDNFFIEQTNDVFINLKDYIGKTIKIEGYIYWYPDSDGRDCYAVTRKTPGCCGSDGLAGLDIRYDGEYPAENTWVEVIGVMGKDTVFGSETPAIQVASMITKEEGVGFVTN